MSARRSHEDMPEAWAHLIEAIGGRSKLAQALDVADSTIYRWSRDLYPCPKAVQIAINALCDQHNVSRIFGLDGGANA